VWYNDIMRKYRNPSISRGFCFWRVVRVNDKNLVPFDKRTESEQRELRSRGGKKSGEARRRKKSLKAAMEMVLALPVMDVDIWNTLSAMGIEPTDMDNQTAMLCALMRKAVSGDVAATKEIRSIIGADNDAERLKLAKKELALKEKGGTPETPVTIVNDLKD